VKILVGVGLLVLGFSGPVSADFTSDIYKKDSQQKEKLYTATYKFEKSPDGSEIRTAEYFDLKGQSVLKETANLQAGRIVKNLVDQKQTKQLGTIEIKSDELVFTIDENGKKQTDSEKFKEPFLLPLTLHDFVYAHWDEIDAGKTFEFRWGVWFRKETVGFEFTKIGEEKINDSAVMVVRMKASSWLIAKLVDPVIFKFNKSDKKLLSVIGRVPPKIEVSGKLKDLDAEVVYKY
jgi:hypothetical protein